MDANEKLATSVQKLRSAIKCWRTADVANDFLQRVLEESAQAPLLEFIAVDEDSEHSRVVIDMHGMSEETQTVVIEALLQGVTDQYQAALKTIHSASRDADNALEEFNEEAT